MNKVVEASREELKKKIDEKIAALEETVDKKFAAGEATRAADTPLL